MESEVMLKFNSNIYSKLNQMAKEYNISSVEEIANLILEERVMYEDIDFLSEHETEKRLKDLRRRALSEI